MQEVQLISDQIHIQVVDSNLKDQAIELIATGCSGENRFQRFDHQFGSRHQRMFIAIDSVYLKGIDGKSLRGCWADLKGVLIDDLQSKIIKNRQCRRKKQVLTLVDPQPCRIPGPIDLVSKNAEREIDFWIRM